jgi:hypothetical protein
VKGAQLLSAGALEWPAQREGEAKTKNKQADEVALSAPTLCDTRVVLGGAQRLEERITRSCSQQPMLR